MASIPEIRERPVLERAGFLPPPYFVGNAWSTNRYPTLLPHVLLVRFVPCLFSLREYHLALHHELREYAVCHMSGEVDLFFEIPIGERTVRSRRPFRRPNRKNEAGGDEERRPHLRPVRTIVVAADIQTHEADYRRIQGEYIS